MRSCGHSRHDEFQNPYQYPSTIIDIVKDQEHLCITNQQLSFTTIVIRLRESIRDQLKYERRYVDLPNQISDIYFFHLHPEQRPNNANEHFCRVK
jgi:hypothetical protein